MKMTQPKRITDNSVAQQATEGQIEYNKKPKIKYIRYRIDNDDWAKYLFEEIRKNIYDIKD